METPGSSAFPSVDESPRYSFSPSPQSRPASRSSSSPSTIPAVVENISGIPASNSVSQHVQPSAITPHPFAGYGITQAGPVDIRATEEAVLANNFLYLSVSSHHCLCGRVCRRELPLGTFKLHRGADQHLQPHRTAHRFVPPSPSPAETVDMSAVLDSLPQFNIEDFPDVNFSHAFGHSSPIRSGTGSPIAAASPSLPYSNSVSPQSPDSGERYTPVDSDLEPDEAAH